MQENNEQLSSTEVEKFDAWFTTMNSVDQTRLRLAGLSEVQIYAEFKADESSTFNIDTTTVLPENLEALLLADVPASRVDTTTVMPDHLEELLLADVPASRVDTTTVMPDHLEVLLRADVAQLSVTSADAAKEDRKSADMAKMSDPAADYAFAVQYGLPSNSTYGKIDLISRTLLEGEWTAAQRSALESQLAIGNKFKDDFINALKTRLSEVSAQDAEARSGLPFLQRAGIALGILPSPGSEKMRDLNRAINELERKDISSSSQPLAYDLELAHKARNDERAIEEGRQTFTLAVLPDRETYVRQQAELRLAGATLQPAAPHVEISAEERSNLAIHQAERISALVDRVVANHTTAVRPGAALLKEIHIAQLANREVQQRAQMMSLIAGGNIARAATTPVNGTASNILHLNSSDLLSAKKTSIVLEKWQQTLSDIWDRKRRPLSGGEFKALVNVLEDVSRDALVQKNEVSQVTNLLARVHGPTGESLFRDPEVRAAYRQGLVEAESAAVMTQDSIWHPEDGIVWKWDGQSVDDIRQVAGVMRISLEGLYEDHFPTGWPESVPQEYQGFVKGRVLPDDSHGENSMAGITEFARLLACDVRDRALVLKGSSDNYTDAEGYQVVEMSKAAALDLVDAYRGHAADRASVEAPKVSAGSVRSARPRG